MAQAYNPVALDPLPGTQIQPPQYQPPVLSPPPNDDPRTGYMGKPGQVADIASNFLSGWMKGKQISEAKKLQQATQNMQGAEYAFKIAQDNAAQVANDPKSTDAQKQQAEQARQTAWKSYLDLAGQYVTPEKKTGQKKGGAKGAFDAIGHHLKQTFGTEDPHLFSQATLALLKTTGPPPVPQKSSQEKLADLELAGQTKMNQAIDALADAHKNGAPPEQIAKLEQQVKDLQGKIESPKEKLDNSLAEATQSLMSGKPVNEQTKSVLEANGYIPKPVEPNVFLQADNKGYLYSVTVDPQTGKTTKSSQPIMKTRVPPDQREEAWQIEQDHLKMVGQLLTTKIKAEHPDWNDQQVKTAVDSAKADAILSGDFKIKVAKGMGPDGKPMTPKSTQLAVSRAINEVRNSNMLDDDEKAAFPAIASQAQGVGGGGWFLNKDLSEGGHWWNKVLGDKYYGLTKEKAEALDSHVRTMAREVLKQQGYNDEQIDEMIPATMGEARDRFGMNERPDETKVGAVPQPPDATGKVRGSDGKWHWTDGKQDLGLAE